MSLFTRLSRRKQKPLGQISMHVRAALLAALSVYVMMAALHMPWLPGYTLMISLSGETLGYVGLALGVTALIIARPLIILFK